VTVQTWALKALSEIDPEAARVTVPALIQMANNKRFQEPQLEAIEALGLIGPRAKQAVPSLLQLATNFDPQVRTYAQSSLLKIDPEAAVKVGITNSVP
jgi:HEAT repeat protein